MMRVNAFSSAMRLDGGEKFFWDAASVCAFVWAENQLKFCSLNYIQLNCLQSIGWIVVGKP